jgi:hypothetical protein
VFVPEYRYTLTEHDPHRPWLVVRQTHRTFALDDGVIFFDWAHDEWPAPRWSFTLDPWGVSPQRPTGSP